jgi:serine O-acetyltransferase
MATRPKPVEDVLEPTIALLSTSNGDALCKACSEGACPSWDDVVEWTERTKQLVLRQRQAAALRAELPALADRLLQMLETTPISGDLDRPAIAARFVERLPEVRARLAEDVEAAFEGDPAAKNFAEIVVAYPSIAAVSIHRLAHVLFELGAPVLARIMAEHAHDKTGIDIHPGATIGRRFFIDHGTGVVIGETTEIGDRVQLYQGVTLGALAPRRGEKARGTKRHPTIEDDVTIYAGATILGGETVIGRGSVIGGNVWLTESVPPGSRVVIEAPRLSVEGHAARRRRRPDWDI